MKLLQIYKRETCEMGQITFRLNILNLHQKMLVKEKRMIVSII